MANNGQVTAQDIQDIQSTLIGGQSGSSTYKKVPGGYVAADGKIIDSNGQIQGTIQDAHIGPTPPSSLSSYLPLAGMIGGAMAVPTDGMSLLPAMALEALGGGIGGGGAEALRAKLTGTPSNISGQAKEGAELGAAGPIVGKVIEAAMGLPAAARTLLGGVSPKAVGDMAAAAGEAGAFHMGGYMGYILSKPFGRVIGKSVEKLLGSDVDPALAKALDSDWFKALSPEQQQSVVDQYQAGAKPTPGNGSGGGLSRPISTANTKPFQSIEDRYAAGGLSKPLIPKSVAEKFGITPGGSLDGDIELLRRQVEAQGGRFTPEQRAAYDEIVKLKQGQSSPATPSVGATPEDDLSHLNADQLTNREQSLGALRQNGGLPSSLGGPVSPKPPQDNSAILRVLGIEPEEVSAAADPEGAAGLSGPQTIRGIPTGTPKGNPQAVSDAIAQALRLGQGNPEIEQTVNSVLSQADDRGLPAGIKPSSAGSTYNPATDPGIKRLTNQLQDSLSGKKVSLRQIGAKGETIAQSEGLTPTEMRAWTQYRAAHQLPNNNYLDLFIQYLRHYGRPPK